jgi:APA family basic amino acid/polyamine antiporter
MLDACTYVFFAYVGFDSVAAVAQEARGSTGRPIAFATIASVVISSLIYIGMCTVRVGLVPYHSLEAYDTFSIAM